MPMLRMLCVLVVVGLTLYACPAPTPPDKEKTQSENVQPPGEKTNKDASVTPEKALPEPTVKEGTPDPVDQPPTYECTSARDCPNGDCVKGKCVKAEVCQAFDECGKDHRCFEGRCIVRCNKDTECLIKGHVCIDGICHDPKWKKGKAPHADGPKKTPVRVGLGVAKLDFPLGVSMAGFGFRPGAKGPYAKALGASTGMYDRFDVKVLIVDNGVDQVVLIRSPLVFSTDFLLTQIVQSVIEKTGVDLSNKIIMTSTHSHSAPARFWNLLPNLNFGTFGGGEFLPEVFRRLRRSFTNAILQAQKSLAPGKIGYVIDPNFDPKNHIFSDRRGENAPYKEPRLLVLKAENAKGEPLAVLVSFPMHGIISSNTMLTNDASGGLEFKLQDRLAAIEKKHVEVFFMQGPAGDVSPRGDRLGHKQTQQMQVLGTLAADHIATLYSKIQTKSDLDVEIVNRRIPLTYKDIGYKKDEFFAWIGGEKQAYRFGAFQCVSKGFPHDSGKRHKDGELKCIFSMEKLHGAAAPQFSKTRMTAARIGDLVLATFPGESTSHIARRLREGVKKKVGDKIKDMIVLGYSQDHQMYIVGEADWWRGGYEASTNIWGPKVGEYFLRHAIELATQLTTPEKEKNNTGILPIDFYKLDLTTTVPRKQTPGAGTVTVQPPKQYKRMAAPFKFTIQGGFHGVDNPHVVLQREVKGTFEDYKRVGGRVYDEFDYRMMMTFAVKDNKNLYTFHFMELESFPTGTYRFRFEGTQWDGSKRASYKGNTDAFKIVASDQLRILGLQYKNKELHGWIAYPKGTNDDGKSALSKLEAVGHRLRSHLVPWQVGGPLAETAKVKLNIKIEQGGKVIETLTSDKLNVRSEIDRSFVVARDAKGKETKQTKKALSSGFKLATKTPLTSGAYQVTVTIEDEHGNTGTWGPKELVVP